MSFNANNMQKMMKQVQKMQADMARVQEELQTETVEVEIGGVIKAVFNGHGEIQGITISPEAVDPTDVEMLQDMILAAVREGHAKSQELASSRLNDVTKGVNIPNIPGLM